MNRLRFKITQLVVVFLTILTVLNSTHAAESSLPSNTNLNANANTNASEFHALSYHDVVASTENLVSADSLSISVDDLVRHFSWLRDNGYSVVSISDVIAARSGGAALPPRAVLLTFDDGYASFHTHVLPLLKLFKYPATLAVVAGWIEAPISSTIEYESDRIDPAKFMTWAQVRECVDSGLVEIASHTFNLHHGEIGNPQGNKQPAVSTPIFDTKKQQYESSVEHQRRIHTDLARGSAIIEARTGKRPRVVVWPYGAYTPSTSEIASELGMYVGLTLDVGVNNNATPLTRLNRALIAKRDTLIDLAMGLQPPQRRAERVLTINSQTLFNADTKIFETNLSKLIDRIVAIKPRSVIFSAYDTSHATTTRNDAPKMWFANKVSPVSADVLNRAAWQIRTRAGVRVFADLPDIHDASISTPIMQTLGQRVPLTGIVFPASLLPSHPTTSPSLAAFKESQLRAESMQRVTLVAACNDGLNDVANGTKPIAAWRAALALHDWVLLRTDACSRSQWQRFAALANKIPFAMQRTIIEHAVSSELDGVDMQRAMTSLEFAQAAGFRHLGISEASAVVDTNAEKSTIEILRRAISIETYPVRR
jgi:peptidoglycan/xylan/chitin deacetylase (PgdA/CDA1 family)